MKKFIGNAAIIIAALLLFAASGLIYWVSTFQIPDLGSFDKRMIAESTKIYDRTGKILLYDLHQDVKRTVVPAEEISRNIKNATVAIEDDEFYQHGGIKITSIIRAFLADFVKGGYSQGGSTITQQVVKNSLLNSEKTISRKLKEWFLSVKLEKIMSKDEILATYLNEAPYGGNIYGIEEASQAYFGKNASSLTLGESAYLASLPNAPSYYSPYGPNAKKLIDRKNLVLKKMLDKNFISKDEYDSAMKEVVSFYPQDRLGIKAPHFVAYIIKYLGNKYGKKALEEGGLKVITTLNYDLQQKAEEIVKKFSIENKQKFKAGNAALAAIDPKTGQILVMVGSRDYFDKEIDGNFNVVTAHRQPGSAFKPFVYAAAFNKGYTPETVLFDLPTEFQTNCDPRGTSTTTPDSKDAAKNDVCYMPQNYDNLFVGPITLRNALAQSRNVPSVKLLYLTGIKESLRLAKDMGIEDLGDANQYGLSLVLGGGEVSLLDITSAYGVFANNGVKNPKTGIIKVEDKEGNILENFESASSLVLPEETALKISDILSDNAARTPLYGNRSLLYFEDRDVAVKTGTTNDYRDAWTVGYSPNIAVGAWVGNNDNSPMEKKVAGLIVAPMWRAFMDEALSTLPKEKFVKPAQIDSINLKPPLRGIWKGGEPYFIDKISGRLATTETPKETSEEVVPTNVHSILYWIDKSDPLNKNQPQNPENDPQFKNWEYSIQEWLKNQNLPKDPVKPTEFDNIHTEKNKPKITIKLNPNKEYDKNEQINIKTMSLGTYPLLKVEYVINGEYIGTSNKPPFDFIIIPNEVENIKKENELRAIGYDSVFNKGEDAVNIKIKF
ncbi:MAG: PBP1A family penicillin-binding protein [Patescibacteria group bacterium]|nr:PBP1A family penicillin-binding protein [Patescibacteria group bacterium]